MQKMPYRRNLTIQGLPLALTLLLAACGGGDSATAVATAQGGPTFGPWR